MKALRSRIPGALLLLLVITGPLLAPFANTAQAMTRSRDVPTSISADSFDCTYVVRRGDDLFQIAIRFNTTAFALAAVNDIDNINLIFPGMVLRVPCTNPPPSPTVCNIHIVQRGEWLALIAARFNVSSQSIAALNHLINPNLIFPGERLLIPCSSIVPGRSITINRPVTGQLVCTPIMTTGSVTVTPFEATLRGRVYNAQGLVVGQSPIHVNGEMGKPGTFSGQIAFDSSKVRAGTFGRVELADISPRDGSVLASASVSVRFACGQ